MGSTGLDFWAILVIILCFLLVGVFLFAIIVVVLISWISSYLINQIEKENKNKEFDIEDDENYLNLNVAEDEITNKKEFDEI